MNQLMAGNVIVVAPDDLRGMIEMTVKAAVSSALREVGVNTDKWISEDEAAAHIGISPHTLRQWRTQKRGPAYRKFGRFVRYLRADLDDYLNDHPMRTIDQPPAPRSRNERHCQ
jgi:predicted DNA-binding transcriptional regulator AlpA